MEGQNRKKEITDGTVYARTAKILNSISSLIHLDISTSLLDYLFIFVVP